MLVLIVAAGNILPCSSTQIDIWNDTAAIQYQPYQRILVIYRIMNNQMMLHIISKNDRAVKDFFRHADVDVTWLLQ